MVAPGCDWQIYGNVTREVGEFCWDRELRHSSYLRDGDRTFIPTFYIYCFKLSQLSCDPF